MKYYTQIITATAAIFDNRVNFLEEYSNIPIIGTIPFACREALSLKMKRNNLNNKMTRIRHIGVIATEGTVTSGAYSRALTAFASADGRPVLVTEMPCPMFMHIAESGVIMTPENIELASKYLFPVQLKTKPKTHKKCNTLQFPIDTIIYGCTHYPVLSELLEDLVFKTFQRPDVKFVDPANAMMNDIKKAVFVGNNEDLMNVKGNTRFCVNSLVDRFGKSASRILKMDVREQVELVKL